MRSVGSRSSHRLRMRCELETLLHTVPLHDPCSEMTTAVAYEMRDEARRADAGSFTSPCRDGWRRADDPACCGGGRRIVGSGAQDEAERVAGGGRKREAARSHLIDVASAQLADHHADGVATQRLLHRPQHVASVRGCDRDQVFGNDAGFVQTGSIGRAILGEREVLGDPDRISPWCISSWCRTVWHGTIWRGGVARRRARFFRRVSGARTIEWPRWPLASLASAARAARASAKPVAAAISVSRVAAISCSALPLSPPPRTPSIRGIPSVSGTPTSPARPVAVSAVHSARRSRSMRTASPSAEEEKTGRTAKAMGCMSKEAVFQDAVFQDATDGTVAGGGMYNVHALFY
jgi:hypothetical protein